MPLVERDDLFRLKCIIGIAGIIGHTYPDNPDCLESGRMRSPWHVSICFGMCCRSGTRLPRNSWEESGLNCVSVVPL